MNAAVFVTLVCALAHMTTAQPVDCSVIFCAGCAADERALDVPGSCCPVCRPAPGVTAKVCPLACFTLCGPPAYECTGIGSSGDCQGNLLCCGNGCGSTCTPPITVTSPPAQKPGGQTTCQYNGQTYVPGEIFFSVEIARDLCEECRCLATGEVMCSPPK